MDQQAKLDWRDGVPVAKRFDDPYYSLEDGYAEACHVFLEGNGLPGRFRPAFHIAELGFGTGLKILAAWAAWRKAGVGHALRFTSFELYPLASEDMARALAQFPEVAALAEELLGGLDGEGWSDLDLEIVVGDARRNLPSWQGQADAWFLDGFAPAKNPELWEPGLLAEVARHTVAGGTAATYSAAGDVRRALEAAGFSVERRPGFGRKRHMTAAVLA